jgi:predicted metal-dependent HD superfamily phosphohydrolase
MFQVNQSIKFCRPSATIDIAAKDRFAALCARLGVDRARAESVYEQLRQRLSESHRHYHHVDHVETMLRGFDARGNPDDAIELAIWFHDSVYEPMSSDHTNEIQSAAFFESQLGRNLPMEQVEKVKRLILATDPSRLRSGLADEDFLVDLDLSILGASPDEYETYRLAVRKEYASVPDQQFYAGREKILRRFLESQIYRSPAFASREAAARANVAWELRAISRKQEGKSSGR